MSLERQIKIILLLALLFSPIVAIGGECKGHIFFYVIDEVSDDSDEAGEAEADFWFYYLKVRKWLPDKGISFSLHGEFPIKAMTCFGTREIVERSELKIVLGYVFVKPNSERRVEGGVMSDVDIEHVINEFFTVPNS